MPRSIRIDDPGNAGAIYTLRDGTCSIVSAGAETRTLGSPAYLGQLLTLAFHTDGGAVTLTAASPFNGTGNTRMVFEDAGDEISLRGISVGGTLGWRVVSNDGVTVDTP